MQLRSVTVTNYKSFSRSQTLALSSGFNVVVGQNNAGKTALLEAVALAIDQKQHRSRVTVPERDPVYLGNSQVQLSFEVSADDLWELLPRDGHYIQIPLPKINDASLANLRLANFGKEELRRFCNWVLSQDSYLFTFTFTPPSQFTASKYPTYGLYTVEQLSDNQISLANCHINSAERRVSDVFAGSAPPPYHDFGFDIAAALRKRLYLFKAERRIARTGGGFGDQLAPDASNLAVVLNQLQANPSRFARFSRLVREVFNTIHAVSVRPTANSELEMLIWLDDPKYEREDLAVPIWEVGTGTGQAIAILYVIFTSNTPQVIIIDEPQSFLHPSALRNLIEICKRFPQHQFIVATHSPTIITAANPATLYQVQLQDRESIITPIDPRQTEQLRGLLSDVGASLADVFGADRILWVEGPTEEVCFPLIFMHFGHPLLGTAVVGVKSSGDFERRRDGELVFDIYERLSSSTLLPPAVAFIFDREGRTEQKRADLFKRSRGKLHFLPRPMYENYLLHPQAIADVVNSCEGFREEALGLDEIGAWIDTNWSRYRLCDGTLLIESVNGAALLKELFTYFSEARVEYDKIQHGAAITRWLLKNSPEHLQDLALFLASVIGLPPKEPAT